MIVRGDINDGQRGNAVNILPDTRSSQHRLVDCEAPALNLNVGFESWKSAPCTPPMGRQPVLPSLTQTTGTRLELPHRGLWLAAPADPALKHSSVLPRSRIGRGVNAAREQKVVRPQFSLFELLLHDLARRRSDLELHWALCLVLQDHRTR